MYENQHNQKLRLDVAENLKLCIYKIQNEFLKNVVKCFLWNIHASNMIRCRKVLRKTNLSEKEIIFLSHIAYITTISDRLHKYFL